MPPAGRVALGIRVRLRDAGSRPVLAGRRAVAFYAVVGPRLPRHDRHLRTVARPALLARAARAPPPPGGAARARVSARLDRRRMGGGTSGRYPVSLARAGHVARRRARAGAMGRPRRRAWRDVVARVVQRDDRGRGGKRLDSVATGDCRARDGRRGLGLRCLAHAHAAAARAGHGRPGAAERGLPRKMGSCARRQRRGEAAQPVAPARVRRPARPPRVARGRRARLAGGDADVGRRDRRTGARRAHADPHGRSACGDAGRLLQRRLFLRFDRPVAGVSRVRQALSRARGRAGPVRPGAPVSQRPRSGKLVRRVLAGVHLAALPQFLGTLRGGHLLRVGVRRSGAPLSRGGRRLSREHH